MVPGAGKIECKNDVQMPGCVLGKLKEELGVQKRMCPCASRSGRLGGARGDRGGARAEEMRRGGRKGEPARGREGGGKAGNDAWNRRKAGGGAGDAATVSGGEAQFGQTAGDVARAGGDQREGGEGGGGVGKGTWTAQSSAGMAGWRTWPGQRRRRTAEENRGEGEKVDEEGPGCKFQKRQGLHCNA
jgi:hypothetical protein